MEKYEVMHVIMQNTTYDVSANYKNVIKRKHWNL